MNALLSTLLCWFCFFSFTPMAEAQEGIEPQMLASTTADITPPEYFEKAEQFYGYIHKGSASTILIQELAGTSYLLIQQGMTPEYFAREGFTYISEEKAEELRNEKRQAEETKDTPAKTQGKRDEAVNDDERTELQFLTAAE